jgi:pilus assembly protein Flp/PilA
MREALDSLSLWAYVLVCTAATRASVQLRRQSGQGMVEYALILVLVAIAAIIVLTLIGQNVENVFNRIAGRLQ